MNFEVRQHPLVSLLLLTVLCSPAQLFAADPPSTIQPLLRVIDLNIGESADVTLCDGSKATVRLIDLAETTDDVCFAVRRADVTVEVNGQRASLVSATYHLPQTVGNVLIDCSITRAFEWQFGDGSAATTPQVQRSFDKPGRYSEVLRVRDAAGHVAYDFAVVVVVDRKFPERHIPSIHPNYSPTTGIRPGDPITFKVRTFNTTAGKELWDFGDGSPAIEVQSDGNKVSLAPDGYAVTTHSFRKPGDYVVRVTRSNEHGVAAVGHVHVQ